jgi:hypothetical protein
MAKDSIGDQDRDGIRAGCRLIRTISLRDLSQEITFQAEPCYSGRNFLGLPQASPDNLSDPGADAGIRSSTVLRYRSKTLWFKNFGWIE